MKTSVLQQLLAELGDRGSGGPQYKAVGDPVGPYLHGPNGLWSYPGLERPVISTRVVPRSIAGMIPARASNVENPLYPYLTGFTDPDETQPDGPCDDFPSTGFMKNCFQTAQFGRYGYQTQVVDITRLGQIINRGEFTDLFLVNNPLGTASDSPAGSGLTWPGQSSQNASLINEIMGRFTALGIKFQNKLMKQVWEGNPANNTNGGYAEFPGLDILIGTGKVDAVTGTSCPSLDSLMVNYNYANASEATGDNSLVNVVTYTARNLRSLADRTNMNPVEWVIAMRETLFYELTAQWPCTYMTYRCMFGDNDQARVNVDGGDMVRMRDEMRNGSYLVIDGVRWRVVLDDALTEDSNTTNANVPNGSFASDIVFLPLTVRGNQAVTFWEYFAWNGPNAALSAATLSAAPLMGNFFWTDGGQYLWHMKPPENYCVQWTALIKPRLVVQTPHLAARISNVLYSPLMHPRDAFPDDPYYVNGGVTSRNTAPSFYTPWA